MPSADGMPAGGYLGAICRPVQPQLAKR